MGGDLKKFLEHKTSHFYSIISPEKMKHLSLQTKIFFFWPDGNSGWRSKTRTYKKHDT